MSVSPDGAGQAVRPKHSLLPRTRKPNNRPRDRLAALRRHRAPTRLRYTLPGSHYKTTARRIHYGSSTSIMDTREDGAHHVQRTDAPGGKPDASDSPWRTLDGRETYSNPWLTVTEYTVLRPDGTHGVYGVVDPGDNVTIAAIDTRRGALPLLGEFRYPLQRWQWLLPGGKVEQGEEPLPAAAACWPEETGLRAENWQALGGYALSSGISSQVTHLFLARGLRQGVARPEGTELQLRTRLLSLRGYAACFSGEIRKPRVARIWRAWHALHGRTPPT